METQFVTIQVPIQSEPQDGPGKTRDRIEAALSELGQPLRWAITALDKAQSLATVEAIVTSAS